MVTGRNLVFPSVLELTGHTIPPAKAETAAPECPYLEHLEWTYPDLYPPP